MSLSHLFLDIETTGIPVEKQLEIAPEFSAPGNYKDPEKIAEAKKAKCQEWLDGAALDPFRAQVIAIGVAVDDQPVETWTGGELELVNRLTVRLGDHPEQFRYVGHNLCAFDLPVLNMAYLRQGLLSPFPFRNLSKYRRELCYDTMLDFASEWLCDTNARISLDKLAWFLGVGRKNGNGADFAKLLAADREKALAYLTNDVETVRKIYLRISDLKCHTVPF